MNRRTLARHRFQRTSAEGGGGGNPPAGGAGTGGNPPAGDQSQNTGPVEAVDTETGLGLGFPDKTRVEDMTDAQKANYWRNQTKVQQKKLPPNLTQLQADAQKWAELQQSQQTPSDQALQAAKEATRQETLKEAAQEAAMLALRTTLQTRGKNAQEVDDLVEFVNSSRLLNDDGKADATKVMSLADKLAPVVNGGNGFQNIGQGRHEQSASDRGAAGSDEAKRRGFTPAERKPPVVVGR